MISNIRTLKRVSYLIHNEHSPKSAWDKGVKQYAEELLKRLTEDTESGYAGDLDSMDPWGVDSSEIVRRTYHKNLERAFLNGAADWKQFSWGGSSLVYNGDIAVRLCTPSELKRTKDGERKPNHGEEWLDCQARALYQAYILIAHYWEMVQNCQYHYGRKPIYGGGEFLGFSAWND